MNICQSCGTKIVSEQQFGTNYDRSINRDFCSDCYRNGDFVSSTEHNKVFNSYVGTMAFGLASSDYYNGIGMSFGGSVLIGMDDKIDFDDI